MMIIGHSDSGLALHRAPLAAYINMFYNVLQIVRDIQRYIFIDIYIYIYRYI